VSCPISSEDKGADEIGSQARREADYVARATLRPSNAAWRPRIVANERRELSRELMGQDTSQSHDYTGWALVRQARTRAVSCGIENGFVT